MINPIAKTEYEDGVICAQLEIHEGLDADCIELIEDYINDADKKMTNGYKNAAGTILNDHLDFNKGYFETLVPHYIKSKGENV
jgi:hypothetical protein